ncbi:MAG: SAM-dependent methyltransferase [Verrucomicrobiota bacterium]|jgi:SAM-dependent MidA family methyltransferase
MKTLVEIIRREMAARGILSFARFMELALYCPVYGYYETKKDNPGRRGDFYTNVSVGELFGQLLAFQFAEWLEGIKTLNPQLLGAAKRSGDGSTFHLIEAGAHDGQLAKDILNWLQSSRPKLFGQIQYVIIEPSARRQEWQKEKLAEFTSRVRWFTDIEGLKLKTRNSKLSGIIFSNELLDAMPVRRFGWDAKQKVWFEWGVAVDGEKFVWAKIHNSQFAIRNPQLEAILPDGYTIETTPAAQNWWREAASLLQRGKLMTIDYGFTADEMFSPSRTRGTLRAYFRHRAGDDLLANVGQQDLTAHVNFSAIQTAGESAGLTTESFLTQPQFLTRILERTPKDKSFGEWNASRTRQFQTLTHPEHLGRAFRVLIQSR